MGRSGAWPLVAMVLVVAACTSQPPAEVVFKGTTITPEPVVAAPPEPEPEAELEPQAVPSDAPSDAVIAIPASGEVTVVAGDSLLRHRAALQPVDPRPDRHQWSRSALYPSYRPAPGVAPRTCPRGRRRRYALWHFAAIPGRCQRSGPHQWSRRALRSDHWSAPSRAHRRGPDRAGDNPARGHAKRYPDRRWHPRRYRRPSRPF